MTEDELEDLAAAVDEAMKPATFEALRDVWPTASQRQTPRTDRSPPAPPTTP